MIFVSVKKQPASFLNGIDKMSIVDGNVSTPLDSHERISALVGEKATRVSFEEWSVRILFADVELMIEAEWELLDKSGFQLDNNHEIVDRLDFALWRVAGRKVSRISISNEQLPILKIEFDNELTLIIRSNDDNFEDWSLVACDSSFQIVCNGGL